MHYRRVAHALYDAIAQNESAVLELGDETLKKIAIELVGAVRSSVTIDWNLKESVRAAMRAKIGACSRSTTIRLTMRTKRSIW